jgi:hypothetical protein
MPRTRRNHLWRLRARRLVTGVALAAYLAVVIGLPVPAAPVKDRRQPFPCQDHPCGCRTAEECWRHCCCFSPEQRLAWAQERGIEPPPYAEEPAAGGWHTARLRDQAGLQTGSCPTCDSRAPQGGNGSTVPASTPRGAYHQKAGCCGKPLSDLQAKNPHHPSRPGLGWQCGVAALHCQGLSPLWVAASAVLPPPRVITWSPDWTCTGGLSEADTVAWVVPFIPPTPPPRCRCL